MQSSMFKDQTEEFRRGAGLLMEVTDGVTLAPSVNTLVPSKEQAVCLNLTLG
jgi:hypothetical protein